MPASRTDIHGPIPLCQMASIRLCRLLLPHCSWRARRFAAPQQHLPPIENPNSLMSPGLFNPELCGGSAPHEFLFVGALPAV